MQNANKFCYLDKEISMQFVPKLFQQVKNFENFSIVIQHFYWYLLKKDFYFSEATIPKVHHDLKLLIIFFHHTLLIFLTFATLESTKKFFQLVKEVSMYVLTKVFQQVKSFGNFPIILQHFSSPFSKKENIYSIRMNTCIPIYAKQYSSVSSVVPSQIFFLFFPEPLSIVMQCLNL